MNKYTNEIKTLLDELDSDYNINNHSYDFRNNDTIEFNVKNWSWPEHFEVEQYLPNKEDYAEYMDYIWVSGNLINSYGDACFNDIQKKTNNFFDDWSFAGRMNGWWVLLFELKDESYFDNDRNYYLYLKKLLKYCETA